MREEKIKKDFRMKIVIIGDVHGRKNWETIMEKNITSADKIVFTGDYFDPYGLETFKQMKEVFSSIVRYKLSEPDKIVLLIGNHDIHYIDDKVDTATRYDFRNAREIKKIFKDAIYYLQYAYQIDNHLFTHAGVSNKWLQYNFKELEDFGYDDIYNLGETINLMGDDDKGVEILNQIGRSRNGWCDSGGPLWADASETYSDIPNGLHQYVGHTQLKNFFKQSYDNSSITYCDVLGFKDEAMIINI